MIYQKILFIGQNAVGSTARMRSQALERNFPQAIIEVIDILIPFNRGHKLWRSMAFRLNIGLAVSRLNSYVQKEVHGKNFDLIWIDKGIFLNKKTTLKLKDSCQFLLYYTPDTSFYRNSSFHFIRSIKFYDRIVYTKAFDTSEYLKYVDQNKLQLVSQGYDRHLHNPIHQFKDKTDHVVFIGLGEPSRYKLISYLLHNKINVKLGGFKWESVKNQYKNSPYLTFLGEFIGGEEYVEHISSSRFGLGLLSKEFPELHTTRTIEIPACGTLLLSERTEDTLNFFKDDEVLFYSNKEELLEKILFFKKNLINLEKVTKKGTLRIEQLNFDYDSIVRNVCNSID